jgi:hypothetical protein
MDFLFYVPFFFCPSAAAAVAEILTVCLWIVYKVSSAQKADLEAIHHFVQIIISRVPKLPESTRRKQAILNKAGLTVL